MTKKDYNVIVNVLRDPSLHLPAAKKRALADRFCLALSVDNPRFNRNAFIAAVMKGEEVE